jgi:hypothetical protein
MLELYRVLATSKVSSGNVPTAGKIGAGLEQAPGLAVLAVLDRFPGNLRNLVVLTLLKQLLCFHQGLTRGNAKRQ